MDFRNMADGRFVPAQRPKINKRVHFGSLGSLIQVQFQAMPSLQYRA
jgi:hypothetical protein